MRIAFRGSRWRGVRGRSGFEEAIEQESLEGVQAFEDGVVGDEGGGAGVGGRGGLEGVRSLQSMRARMLAARPAFPRSGEIQRKLGMVESKA